MPHLQLEFKYMYSVQSSSKIQIHVFNSERAHREPPERFHLPTRQRFRTWAVSKHRRRRANSALASLLCPMQLPSPTPASPPPLPPLAPPSAPALGPSRLASSRPQPIVAALAAAITQSDPLIRGIQNTHVFTCIQFCPAREYKYMYSNPSPAVFQL